MSELVTITSIAGGGDGVGRLGDGRAIFVPRTAPGEQVRLGAVEKRKNFARGAIGEIVTAGPARIVPACRHYVDDDCGGCQLQHLSYDAQLAAKRSIVGEALRRIGKLDLPDPEIVEAAEEWRYRAKITLAVKAGHDGRGITAGFHPQNRPNAVFALHDCHIADVRLMALWRALVTHLDLLPNRPAHITLRLDREGNRHVIVESSGEPWLKADEMRRALSAGDGDVICWWQPTEGAARVMAGPATGFPATAFEQVHPEMGGLARQWAVRQLGPLTDQLAWDLYGGIGDTAIALAGAGASVVSVDADEKAVTWARSRPGVERIRFIAGKTEDVLPTLEDPPAAAVVNPPRAGLHWDVTLRLTGEPVPKLVYISCDPATLARDLSRLSTNYHVTGVKAFDLFPQTAHVETVAVLEAA
ncbi:MAG TPA: TRAM domain-containing protein [Gemmatimonadales bacterium]|nr:TRAM domain-containing protein [Gemmatimonadales bacterium]